MKSRRNVRWSVAKSVVRGQNESAYRKEVLNFAYHGGFEIQEDGDRVLKDGVVISNGRRRWRRAFEWLKYGGEEKNPLPKYEK